MAETYQTVDERRPGKAVMWILLGAILIGIGTLLPFANVELEAGEVSASLDEDLKGLDFDRGKLYLVIAIGLVVLGIIALTRAAALSRTLLVITLLASALTVVATVIDIADLEDSAFDSFQEDSPVEIDEEALDVGSGFGLYVVLAGGVVAALGSLRGLVTRRKVVVQEARAGRLEDDRD